MPETTESPILIDVWTVDPERRDELIGVLSENVHAILARQPGFLSSEIFESIDGGVVVLIVRMRSAEERQRMMDLADAQGAYRSAQAIAHTHANLYSLVEAFAPPGA